MGIWKFLTGFKFKNDIIYNNIEILYTYRLQSLSIGSIYVKDDDNYSTIGFGYQLCHTHTSRKALSSE